MSAVTGAHITYWGGGQKEKTQLKLHEIRDVYELQLYK